MEGTGKFLLRQELLEVNSDKNPVFKRGAKDNNRKVKYIAGESLPGSKGLLY